MNQLSNSSERRQSFRWPVSGPRQEGELRFGEKRLKVRLLDESAGGFSALCEQPVGVEAGAKGLLCAGEDWFDVRVASIEPVASPPVNEDDGKPLSADFFRPSTGQTSASPGESTPEPLPETSPAWCRLGLYRMNDAFNPDIKPAYHSWAGLTCHLKRVSSGTIGVIFMGIVLAITVVIIPLSYVRVISTDTADAELKDGIHWLSHQQPGLSKTADEDRSPFKAFVEGVAKTWSDAPNAAGHSSNEPKLSSQFADEIAELRKTIQRLPGAMPFALPEVVKQLQLTESQQKRIRELVETAANMIRNLVSFPDKDGSGEKNRGEKAILESTRNKALELLDDNQKKKWYELTGESREERKKAAGNN